MVCRSYCVCQEKHIKVVVYVDDIVVTGSDDDDEIKDLGSMKYFLGIEVARSNDGIAISQRKYTLTLLKEIGKLGAKPEDTPAEQNHYCTGKPENYFMIKGCIRGWWGN